uniref:SH3 domain-containing protein n=1 Tax=Schmidtea mediterranea TaxID=79327 RepID=A0A5P8I4M3_SCHMD|nr:hypothetical protein [Schmidtea mediterranea]
MNRNMKQMPQIVMEYAVMIDDFIAEGSTELSTKRGDFVQVLYHIDKKWAYICRQVDKRAGYVPFLYCAFIKSITFGNIGDQLSVVAVKPQTKELLRVNTQAGSCSSGRSSLTDTSEMLSPYSLSSDKSSIHQLGENKLTKARSEPDGGSWVEESKDNNQEIITPPSPYINEPTSSKCATRKQSDFPVNIKSSRSFSGKILANKPSSMTPNLGKRGRLCEPYKTIVNELEDCLEKLTLV